LSEKGDLMRDLDPVTQRRLNGMTEQLVGEFEADFDAALIRELMKDSAERLAETAVVSDYLPALTYRLTKERLLANERFDSRERAHVDIVYVSLTGVGRGEIAAALTTLLAGDRVTVHTAGTAARAGVDPAVASAIDELGVNVSDVFARPMTSEVLRATDVVVTMGHSVGEIDIPSGVRHEDWRVGDPTGAPLDEVRRVRDDIEHRVRTLLDTLGIETGSPPV
jgi:ArsR family transcriptional regulator